MTRAGKTFTPIAASVATLMFLAGCSSSGKSTAGASNTVASTAQSTTCTNAVPGVTSSSIKIGEISINQGPLASFADPYNKGFEAYVAALNARGGVFGRKIDLTFGNDGATPETALTTAQQLVQQQSVFAVFSNSFVEEAFLGYLRQQNIPVVSIPSSPAGFGFPNTFSYLGLTGGGSGVADEAFGKFMKAAGGSRVATVALNAAAPIANAKAAATAARAQGLQVVLESSSTPASAAVFTAQAQQIKDSGADTVFGAILPAQFAALVQALKSINYVPKVMIQLAGYGEDITNSAQMASALEGTYTSVNFTPLESPKADSKAVADYKTVLAQYAPGTLHDFQSVSGYITGNLLETGLKAAGPCPTRQGLIDALTAQSAYKGDGFLNPPVNMATLRTSRAPCLDFVQLVGGKWQEFGDGPICGKILSF